ncbi:hypothetical protein [Klebsiella pneumoniae]|uniref:hypothetical protein n=1 Tax=Klebsiella pneumoniae TaxID=573 RepID=UPI003F66B3B2
MLDISLKPKQGSQVLIQHGGGTELATLRGKALITEDGDLILIRKQGHLKELRVKSTPPVEAMIARRRERYPEDVYLFQSHSNRVKYHRRPVTIIAFNAALRRAARSLPDVNVSSSSARNIPD